MTYSRTVNCHYSFLHENLLDMNHQFLHRGVVGRITELLDYETGLVLLNLPVRAHWELVAQHLAGAPLGDPARERAAQELPGPRSRDG